MLQGSAPRLVEAPIGIGGMTGTGLIYIHIHSSLDFPVRGGQDGGETLLSGDGIRMTEKLKNR